METRKKAKLYPETPSNRRINILNLNQRVAAIREYEKTPVYNRVARLFNCSATQIKGIVRKKEDIQREWEGPYTMSISKVKIACPSLEIDYGKHAQMRYDTPMPHRKTTSQSLFPMPMPLQIPRENTVQGFIFPTERSEDTLNSADRKPVMIVQRTPPSNGGIARKRKVPNVCDERESKIKTCEEARKYLVMLEEFSVADGDFVFYGLLKKAKDRFDKVHHIEDIEVD